MKGNVYKVLVIAVLAVISLTVIIGLSYAKNVEIRLEETREYGEELGVQIIYSKDDVRCGEMGLENYLDGSEEGSVIVSDRKIERIERKSPFSHYVTVYVSGEKSGEAYIYSVGKKIYFDEREAPRAQVVTAG